MQNKTRIFLLNPPYKKYFIRSARWAAQSISASNWYPIWLAYACGLLGKEGFNVKLLDALADNLTFKDTLNIVSKFSPQICVIYSSFDSKINDVKIAQAIKEKTNSLIVFVGPWVSSCPEEFLKEESVDIAAVGEFDEAILELAKSVPKEKIKGILYKKKEGIIKNPSCDPVSEERLEDFPFVTEVYRRHLEIRNYHQAPQLYPFVDLFTGRGCDWGKCSFCLWPHTMNQGFSYRQRKMKSVIEEFKYIKKQLPFVKEVFIQDDTFPAYRAKEFSLAILEKNIKMVWSCYARVDLDFQTLKLMKKAGCRCLHVGYESADNQILKQCAKGITRQMAEEFTYYASKLGFIIHADFIFGLPGETQETIKNTISWARKLPLHSYQFTVPHVYPQTPLYMYLARFNFLIDGRISYPYLSYEELISSAKEAIRACHFNLRYILRMLKKPREFLRGLYYSHFVIRYLLNKE